MLETASYRGSPSEKKNNQHHTAVGRRFKAPHPGSIIPAEREQKRRAREPSSLEPRKEMTLQALSAFFSLSLARSRSSYPGESPFIRSKSPVCAMAKSAAKRATRSLRGRKGRARITGDARVVYGETRRGWENV